MAEQVVATYSIVACDLDAGQWGVATQSKFLAVGSVVPWAEANVGAVATQSYANPQLRPRRAAAPPDGLSAEDVVARLTEADEGRDQRQLGIVDAPGRRGHVHRQRVPRLGRRPHRRRASPRRATSSSPARPSTRWPRRSRRRAGRPLAERLLDCLDAAQAAGGDRRGQQSAALLVVEKDAGYAGLSDRVVDLRVDDHAAPARGAPPPVRHPPRAVRPHAAGRVGRGRRRARAPSCASGSRGSATTRNCRRRSRAGPAARTWKSGSTASSGSTRSCSER